VRDDGAAALQHRDNMSTISDPGPLVFSRRSMSNGVKRRASALRAKWMRKALFYRCHNLLPLIRLAIEGGTLFLFFWDNYDGRQPAGLFGRARFCDFGRSPEVESAPQARYLNDVFFDLALPPKSGSNVSRPDRKPICHRGP